MDFITSIKHFINAFLPLLQLRNSLSSEALSVLIRIQQDSDKGSLVPGVVRANYGPGGWPPGFGVLVSAWRSRHQEHRGACRARQRCNSISETWWGWEQRSMGQELPHFATCGSCKRVKREIKKGVCLRWANRQNRWPVNMQWEDIEEPEEHGPEQQQTSVLVMITFVFSSFFLSKIGISRPWQRPLQELCRILSLLLSVVKAHSLFADLSCNSDVSVGIFHRTLIWHESLYSLLINLSIKSTVRTKQMLIWNPLTFYFSSGSDTYFQSSSSTQSSICFALSRFDLHLQPWNYKHHMGPYSTPSSRQIWNMIFLNLSQIFAWILSGVVKRLIAHSCCFSGVGNYFLL